MAPAPPVQQPSKRALALAPPLRPEGPSAAASIVSAVVSLVTLCALTVCLTRRAQRWRRLSVPGWVLLAFYLDSILFVVVSATLRSARLGSSRGLCQAGIIVCLFFYTTGKVLIYYFLVEKVHAVHHPRRPRRRNKLYLFNCVSALLPYAVLAALAVHYRVGHLDADVPGLCVLGLRRPALIPLIVVDVALFGYLTALFLFPLRRLYSWDDGRGALRAIARRTCVGSAAALAATTANGVVMLVLGGEAGWVCFLACNLDILSSALVLYWVTSTDEHKDSSDSVMATTAAAAGAPTIKQVAGGDSVRSSLAGETERSMSDNFDFGLGGQRYPEQVVFKTDVFR
ncbi:uncharacterized protein K452DRAFT_302874 [Aplosporella prunicola CBS 121167]|uniref:G-protein coupled receptors family 1 profile domain-containing protein n=1 Tax=Aplosporella prunicola CBS 121167 TaxID=1176127 RepID=A0A6A6AX11_9PEZI|nr:uncharacterized protein K452DRAFT_302874 [Aplosporella prunicola CBS 121167]KAF2136280.1 hypothetical protein K452DRAFT_302874 [Aplosporella prunicola CBS 121167]